MSGSGGVNAAWAKADSSGNYSPCSVVASCLILEKLLKSQLSSLETAKQKEESKTFQVQMLAVRVLSVSLAHRAADCGPLLHLCHYSH